MQASRKILAPLAAVVLALLLSVAIYVSVQRAAVERAARAVVAAHGIVGSEKGPFFNDPAVISEFRKNGVDIHVQTEGSREQATTGTKDGGDFYFPAGEPAGRALAKKLGVNDASTPFYTPMVIASWEPIAKILERNGIVKRAGSYWYVVQMPKLLDLVRQQKRWNEIPGNTDYAVGKTVLISSTDARKSNSADMYLALASYVFNNNEIVTRSDQVAKLQPDLNSLFLRQGFQESSSAGPFDDYVTIGIGKTPMVMAYEQQWIEYLVSHSKGDRPAGMVLLYPKPTIFTKHTIVPTDDTGRKVAQLLETDPVLRTLEIQHGFRNDDVGQLRTFWKSQGIDLPQQVLDVVDPPSFEVLESMIGGIERAYKAQ